MTPDRLFLDASYVIAILNAKDQHHQKAISLRFRVRDAAEVWTTEAVLVEIGNGLSATYRVEAANFIRLCYLTSNIRVVNITTRLMTDAIDLYRSRQDKTWGLTDCISFVVMDANRISDALTADKHFEQAGFRALLR